MKLQEKVNSVLERIEVEKGFKYTPEIAALHLVEEVGELVNEIVTEKIKHSKTNLDNLKTEIADIFILLAKIANLYKVDIEECVNLKLRGS
jgi:NTP pyrophosphatase (non-canonical NTP hydrolase)